jgi:uncharacterized protein YjbJ (UPF0337 family)
LDRFEGNWNQTKEKIRGKWRKLTPTISTPFMVAAISLNQPIEQRYGFAPDYVHKEVDDWCRWQDWRTTRGPIPLSERFLACFVEEVHASPRPADSTKTAFQRLRPARRTSSCQRRKAQG